EPVFQVAFLLTVAGALWPVAGFESQIATLVALAAGYAAAAFLLRPRTWAYVATYLAVLCKIRQLDVPPAYTPAAKHLGLDQISTTLGCALFAAALLALAEIAVRRTGEARRPLLETAIGMGRWRSLFAAPFFSAGYLMSSLAVGLALGEAGGALFQ